MDDWAKNYLRTWQSDFADEPDAELYFRFLENVLSDLQRLPQEGPTNADAIYDKVSNSIIAAITSLPHPDLELEYVQDVLFDAAISSPAGTSALANVTRLLIDNLPTPSKEKLEKGIASNTRERWNGPDKPDLGTKITECIEKWVSLNMFVAHLTRLHAPLWDYGIWSLDRAFNPQAGGYREDERVYHVPAAAAWIHVLGAEIYRWSLQGDPPGKKWEKWKLGFKAVSQSSDVFPADTREKAQIAFNSMRDMEGSIGPEI